MNKFLKALGFKESAPPEPVQPRLGIDLRGGGYATFTGDVDWILMLRERIDAREESYIRAVTNHPRIFGDEPFTTEDSHWIPDVVSYWVDWGDFEPEDEE